MLRNTTTVHSLSENSPCPCESGMSYSRCCAALTSSKQAIIIKASNKKETGTATHFLICTLDKNIYRDDEGRIPVFTSRAQANRTRELLGWPYTGVMGMLEKNFEVFAFRAPEHYLVPNSNVLA